MPIVTLTTDYGLRDPYAGQLKGAILSAAPSAQLVDCTHLVAPYDLVDAAYHLGHTWGHFPPGTIHICTVNRLSEREPEPFICFRQNGHYFLCPNNGLAFLLFPELESKVFLLEATHHPSKKGVIASAIGMLALGYEPSRLGPPLNDAEKSIRPDPVTNPSFIRGAIVHIDGYGNAILNIHRDLVERMAKGRRIQTRLPNSDPIHDIVEHYHQVAPGELLTRYNNMGYLEIAMNMGKVATLYGLERDQLVQLEFQEF